jgi:hypothetical protein
VNFGYEKPKEPTEINFPKAISMRPQNKSPIKRISLNSIKQRENDMKEVLKRLFIANH